MNNTRGAVFALIVLGGVFAWLNRLAIQRRLEAIGIRTPLFRGNIGEVARSAIAKTSGRVEHGVDRAEDVITRRTG